MANDILWGMEKQEITMVIILDLSAAFNTMDHDVLPAILRRQFVVSQKKNGSVTIYDQDSSRSV